MPTYEEQTGRTKRIVIEPEITRAYWSQRRAWHSARVKLFIEARYVPDGTPVKVEIWEDDTAEGSPDDFIASLPGEHKIKNNRCAIDYQVRWDQASLGKELALEGDEYEFVFVVTIDKPALKKRSNLLYVDLDPLIISA
jgi:hypothetical protein